MAKSSRSVYSRAWALFSQAMGLLNVYPITSHNLPFSFESIIFFVGYLHCLGLAPATIITYTSAIGYFHRIKNLQDPTSAFVVQKMLASITKLDPRGDTRLPITIIILGRLVQSTSVVINDSYQALLTRAMFIIAFFGLMRVGEICLTQAKNPVIQLDQVKVTPQAVTIKILHFKHNISPHPFDIVLPAQANSLTCPVKILSQYLLVRGMQPGPLFIFKDGAPVCRTFFASRLKSCLNSIGLEPSLYQSHSFRIGAASHYASLGMSDSQLRMLGRWKSDAFKRYIRCQRIIAALNINSS